MEIKMEYIIQLYDEEIMKLNHDLIIAKAQVIALENKLNELTKRAD